jgi:Beta-lactamase superfamily domain
MVANGADTTLERPKHQLQSDLQEAHREGRPVLTHLNADTTWLISLPYPAGVYPPPGRCRYNVLVDPWLKGAQSDVASWFSSQVHLIESSVQTLRELDQILAEIEDGLLENETEKEITRIDLVAISHEFTDHCHEATLKELSPKVPIFSTAKAVELIKSWKYFESVTNMTPFTRGIDWHTTSIAPLPSWLGVSRLITEGNALYYHSAIIFSFTTNQPTDPGPTRAETIIYTPHGVEATTFSTVATADPAIDTLAFMHGLHDVSITLTKQLNLGAHNALKAQRILKAKYWVGTHDEVKKGSGLIGPLLRRKQHTVEDALKQARKLEGNGDVIETKDQVRWVDLRNGESLVLS